MPTGAVSLQIREILAEHTHLIEPLALDEAYLDVTENRKGIETATEIAMELRARIRAETGLTASAGVSYNKFLAKLASDHRKPDGFLKIWKRTGMTVLFVTHSIDEALQLSDRIFVLSAQPGRLSAIIESPLAPYRMSEELWMRPEFPEYRLKLRRLLRGG
jgi:hypothetical protein